MTQGRVIVRNTLWNFAGLGAPLIIAFVAVPIVLGRLGTDRFGILLLAWATIGYFSLFDFGLPRVLTLAVSSALVDGDEENLTRTSQSGLVIMTLMGLGGSAAAMLLTPWLTQSGLKIPAELQAEAARSFYILSACVPFVVMTAGLRGLMEAHQDFALATALRLPYAAFNYLAPLLTVGFSRSLVPIVLLLLFGRVVTWVLHLVFCLRRYPYLRRRVATRRGMFAPLLRLGGWMTTSNLISPLMQNVDRFVIGNVLSLAAVTYYVTPFELVTKLSLIPTAVIGVLFPAFAAAHVRDDGQSVALLERAIRLMAIVMFPGTLVILSFAPEILTLWVGPTIAAEGARAAQWLAIGVFVNSIAQIPFTVFQSSARPDITAKLHLIELPVYGIVLWTLMHRFGVAGVAAAWAIRMTFDLALLLVALARKTPAMRTAILRPFRIVLPLGLLLILPMFLSGTLARAAAACLTLAVSAFFLWTRAMQHGERELVLRFIPAAKSTVSP